MLEILLVDDEPSILLPFDEALRGEGYKVVTASDGLSAVAAATSRAFDVVISDIRLPQVDGLTLFRKVRKESPSTRFILMTAFSQVPDAVSALKEGAVDYLVKPFDLDELLKLLSVIAREHELRQAFEEASRKEASETGGGVFLGESPAILRMLGLLDKFAASNAAVLISGESGVGKELIAGRLHARGPRNAEPFVAVNCAGFPETLLEAELFGHERGAFTGAVKAREGRFKAAHKGTLFLDEIAEMPMPAQAKLLRVLQNGTFEPLGTNQMVSVDVRIVSATHRNLKDRVAEGLFREDLYYRLKVLELPVPPLREHRGDLPLLVDHFLRRFATHGAVPRITSRTLAALATYPFPGNIRELEHAIQHAVIVASGEEVDLKHLPREIAGTAGETPANGPGFRPLPEAVREFEREYLRRAVEMAKGKRTQAAQMLGISRKNLWEKLRGYGLNDPDAPPRESDPP